MAPNYTRALEGLLVRSIRFDRDTPKALATVLIENRPADRFMTVTARPVFFGARDQGLP